MGSLQVVHTINSTIGMPQWVVRATVVLLAAGLPIVMITAFVQKGWGGRREHDEVPPANRRPFTWRRAIGGGVLAFAFLGVGTAAWLTMRADLEYETGDLEAAAAYYAELVALWEHADPELQPRVESARLRLEQILKDRG